MKRIEQGNPWESYQQGVFLDTPEKIIEYLRIYLGFLDDMARDGFDPKRGKDALGVVISRDGRILKINRGLHRLAMAQRLSHMTDLVLTITEMLRKKGVVGKFVEFYGPGLAHLTIADRVTLGNMCPEYGATVAMFPIDNMTLDYLRLTGREPQHVKFVEAYAKTQGIFRNDDSVDPVYSETMELDLSTVKMTGAFDLPNKKARFNLDAPSLLGTSIDALLVGDKAYYKVAGMLGGMLGASADKYTVADVPESSGEPMTDPSETTIPDASTSQKHKARSNHSAAVATVTKTKAPQFSPGACVIILYSSGMETK